ncbi:MAG: neutral/alkaline non-lysosomal ceramidase N-terminal domain-containing protein [Candidatus Hodarchaeota archaeon]
MRAGFCKQVITPPLGQVSFAGYSGRRFLPRGVLTDENGVRHELYARALVLEPDDDPSPEKKICLVQTDLFMIRHYWINEVRKLANELTGIPEENICIHATHSHQGPDSLGIYYPNHDFDPSFLDEEWLNHLKRQIAGVIFGASVDVKPCLIGVGEGKLEGWTVNRRDQGLFDNPPRNPRTVDPQVPIIKIDDMEGNTMVVITAYATHPTFLTSLEEWNAEHVTFLVEETKKQIGRNVELMYFTAQAGDIIPFMIWEGRLQLVLNPQGKNLKKHQLGININKNKDDKSIIEVDDIEKFAKSAEINLDQIIDALRKERGINPLVKGGKLIISDKARIRDVFITISKVIHADRSYRKAKYFASMFIAEIKNHLPDIKMDSTNDIMIDRELVDVEIDDADMADQYSPLLNRENPRNREDGKILITSEVQGIKIANSYIICTPSEPVNEIGLRLKKLVKDQGKIDYVFFFQMCNDGFGYVVPPFEHEAKGYEVSIFCFGKNIGMIFEEGSLRVASRLLEKDIHWEDVDLPVFKQAEWRESSKKAKEEWLKKQ